ncbi:MAG: NADPH-dependent F420 reductase [Actinomycetota bacterium]|jgi:NADPH-dependent F420 reductase|nr:NADPH-dependent F420 reductase [Actinomycetota bacterium]
MSSVGILGGTGPAGQGVALRMASAGYDVVLGSRDAERAGRVAAELAPRGPGSVTGADNDAAAHCDIVVVATPWDSAVATVSALKDVLGEKVVISMVNALAREGRELVPIYPPRGSMAAQIAHALPRARVVGAFHHLPASEMVQLDSGLDADVVIFGDDAGARESVAQVVEAMPGLHAVVAGSMSLASAVEAFTAVCISINIRHKAHSYVKLAGLAH